MRSCARRPRDDHGLSDGQAAFSSPANTGIPQAPTALGTYPVYLRYASTTMQGTNPDGTHYNDPGVPWVSCFNGGDAVHGFLRGSYGSPQSRGCVELPYAAAEVAFGLMNYGTLVTVTT
jgi:lipoprotein-anchoring transpeptidase ErfK/SrfK